MPIGQANRPICKLAKLADWTEHIIISDEFDDGTASVIVLILKSVMYFAVRAFVFPITAQLIR